MNHSTRGGQSNKKKWKKNNGVQVDYQILHTYTHIYTHLHTFTHTHARSYSTHNGQQFSFDLDLLALRDFEFSLTSIEWLYVTLLLHFNIILDVIFFLIIFRVCCVRVGVCLYVLRPFLCTTHML